MSTISEAITKDHQELATYYNEVINNPDNLDQQQRYGNQFVWELARHSVGEELIVYPAFEKHLGARGKEMAEKDRKEHSEVKETLKSFQGMKSSDPDFVSKLKEIWGPLKKHMEEEEKEEMPALEKELASSKGASEAMAKSFERTKKFVPSRSHPAAGEHPPFETVMGLLTAPIDHIADLFRKFPDERASL